jgi:hypothetical protein
MALISKKFPLQDQDNDFFNDPVMDNSFVNKRSAVRYIRKDLTAILFSRGFFQDMNLMVKLIDISSKGALISSSRKINRKNISLQLIFRDGKKFRLPASIVHKRYSHGYFFYGLKFSRISNKLGEHLLKTQTDLLLK